MRICRLNASEELASERCFVLCSRCGLPRVRKGIAMNELSSIPRVDTATFEEADEKLYRMEFLRRCEALEGATERERRRFPPQVLPAWLVQALEGDLT